MITMMIGGSSSRRVVAAMGQPSSLLLRTARRMAGTTTTTTRRMSGKRGSLTAVAATAPTNTSSSQEQQSRTVTTGDIIRRHYHSSTPVGFEKSNLTTPWADPASRQYKFWNREESAKNAAGQGQYSFLIEISPEVVQREAKILCLGDTAEEADHALHSGALPLGASLLGVGTTLADFDNVRDSKPNIIFVSPSCPRTAAVLPLVLAAFPSVEWIHCRSAGIDFVESDEFADMCTTNNIQVTNAKGQFSSSLAEYALMACSYFAKDLPRLMANQRNKTWKKYDVEELRGKTMGIIGYGDIGRACAKLATVYGMRVVALRRHPYLSKNDPMCDKIYGRDAASRNDLMAESDYVVCSAPSTVETRGMVSAEAFGHAKKNAVFINLGRGPVVDENALLECLKSGKLKGAALDVFTEEPLPADSPFWELPNVLISPHNMDQTATFMHEATEFFLNENLPRFLCGEELLNPVDPNLGY